MFRLIYTYYKIIYYKLIYGRRVYFGNKIRLGYGFNLRINKDGVAFFGHNFSCRDNFFLELGEKAKVHFGSNVFFNRNATIVILEELHVDSNNLFGMNVNIIDHGYKFFPHFFIVDLVNSKKKIVIGENNWFSSNVSILKNVRIGNSVVVAYGTILSNDTIQSNTFVKSDVMVNMSEIVIKN